MNELEIQIKEMIINRYGSLKRILGHDPGDITSKVYTHLTNEQLLNEINKIK